MSVKAAKTGQMTIGGLAFPQSVAAGISADGSIAHEATIPAVEPSVLTTRSTDTTGDLTADNSGHVITTGQRVDLYWTESGVNGSRRGVAVGTVAGSVVPISGGAGDVLPTAAEAVQIAPTVLFDLSLDGDEVKALAAHVTGAGRSQVTLEGSSTERLNQPMGAAQSYHYYDGQGPDNPLAGVLVDTAYLSQSGSVVVTGRVGALHNNA